MACQVSGAVVAAVSAMTLELGRRLAPVIVEKGGKVCFQTGHSAPPPPLPPPYLPFPLISSPSCYQHLNFFEYVCVRYHGTGTLVGDLLAEMKRKPEPPVPQSN